MSDVEALAKADYEQYCHDWFYCKAKPWSKLPENVRQRWRDRARPATETSAGLPGQQNGPGCDAGVK